MASGTIKKMVSPGELEHLESLYWHEASANITSAGNTDGTYNFTSLIPSGATLVAAFCLGYSVSSTWEIRLIAKSISVGNNTLSYRTQGGTASQTYSVRFGFLVYLS